MGEPWLWQLSLFNWSKVLIKNLIQVYTDILLCDQKHYVLIQSLLTNVEYPHYWPGFCYQSFTRGISMISIHVYKSERQINVYVGCIHGTKCGLKTHSKMWVSYTKHNAYKKSFIVLFHGLLSCQCFISLMWKTQTFQSPFLPLKWQSVNIFH